MPREAQFVACSNQLVVRSARPSSAEEGGVLEHAPRHGSSGRQRKRLSARFQRRRRQSRACLRSGLSRFFGQTLLPVAGESTRARTIRFTSRDVRLCVARVRVEACPRKFSKSDLSRHFSIRFAEVEVALAVGSRDTLRKGRRRVRWCADRVVLWFASSLRCRSAPSTTASWWTRS